MTQPMKRAAFAQGVYAQSASDKEVVGTIRILKDGTKWRYCRAGATLAAGKLVIAASIASGVMDQACASAHAIGDTQITETITPGVAYAENYFRGGYFHVNDGTGQGYAYPITSSTAVGVAGDEITLTLGRGFDVATVATTSKFTIAHNPCMAVTHPTAGTGAGHVVGVTPRAVTDDYYFWAQIGGEAICLMGDTSAVGAPLMPDTDAGGLTDYADASNWAVVAKAWGTAGVDTDYKPVYLNIG